MPEAYNNKSVFTLPEVTRSIQITISGRYKTPVWIRAELNKLNYYKQSGHCFPELVEKQEGRVLAQMRAIIWKDDFVLINREFQRVLQEPLKDGIKILFLATISFDPTHGLALRILDIDPSFTLGDLEREKQDTIKRLKNENLYDKNRELRLALLPQRMAVISVESSKGYADFIKIIESNARGYRFFHMLFPSLLQGEKAIATMMDQLNRIRRVRDHFDLVVIVRGGGDDIGLSFLNDYRLARAISEFPLPVLTGIGHSTNETVCEMISYSNAITPTKLAEWLLQKFHDFREPVEAAKKTIIDKSIRLLSEQQTRFRSEVKMFRSVTSYMLQRQRNNMKLQTRSLIQQSDFRFRNEKADLIQFQNRIPGASNILLKSRNQELEHIGKQIKNMSPENVLKRGYSITLLRGRAIKSFEEVQPGDILNTTVFAGNISSIVQSTHKPETHE
ncbi:MAG TPA: exodeoxyribonuclease VII large subunit [Puia sp.]|nr:exodeoxyribonuclease VII large subunit [Puia sp.]